MTHLNYEEFVITNFKTKEDKGFGFWIYNNKKEQLGRIEKVRVGAWMSYCLFLNEDCYLSASCLDEVREKIKELNRTSNKKVK